MSEVDLARRLLAGTNPLPDQALEGVASRPTAVALRQRLVSSPRDPSMPLITGGTARLRRGPVPRRRTAVLLVAACAAVLVTVTLVLAPWAPTAPALADNPPILDYGLVGDTPFGDATGGPAVTVLTNLADAAETRPTTGQTGDVAYIRTDNWFFTATVDASGTSAGVRPTSMEVWTAPDGSIVRRSTDAPLLQVGGRLAQDDSTGVPETDSFPAGSEFHPNDADLESVGETALRPLLLEVGGCASASKADAACLLRALSLVHGQSIVSGTVDGRMWRMLAAEKGVVSLGDVVDRAGRPAVAITTSLDVGAPVRLVLLADPSTGALLGTEEVAMDPNAGYVTDVPAVVGFTAYLAVGWTSSMPG